MWLRWKGGTGEHYDVRKVGEKIRENGMWLRWKGGKGEPEHWRAGLRREGMWLRWKDGKGKEEFVHNIGETAYEEGMWLRWKDGQGKRDVVNGISRGSGFRHNFEIRFFSQCYDQQCIELFYND